MNAQILKKMLMALLLISFASCGDKSEEEVKRGIESAISDLTSGSCQRAIDTLNEVGYQNTNIRYLKTYASAYACRAGYSTSKFFVDDLPLIGSPSELGGFARFSTSLDMRQPRDGKYSDLQVAIDALLYAGGIPRNRNPTLAERRGVFGAQRLNDLHAQLMYLLFVQFGKFLNYYGNSSDNGAKGGGSNINNCLANYDQTITIQTPPYADIEEYLRDGGLTGSCDNLEPGHPDLDDGAGLNTERLCQGAVLFNNILEVAPEVISSAGGDDFGDASDMVDQINVVLTGVDNADAEAVGILSQEVCEETFESSNNGLQVFYVLIMETLFE